MTGPAPASPGPRSASRRLTTIVWTLLSLGLFAVILGGMREMWQASERHDFRELPVLGQLNDFRLIERDGQPRTLADLKGQIWFAGFFFTDCQGPCPALIGQMVELSRAVARTKGKVRVVAISVDPETDTPERLREYAKRMGVGDNFWLLTGPLPEVFRIAREGFKVAVEENPPGAVPQAGKMLHSTKVALVDAQGRIRGYYDGTGGELLGRALPDLGDLMHEAGEGNRP
ncbi:MAG: SCO family protein [Verrucomicrobia bacterium]|nr:SCO family protein [Verrucomicrobiota bacterium]